MNAVDPQELRLLSDLLGAPTDGSLELLREAATELRWLEEPVAELAQLPLDRWQGEHTRLFIAGFPRTPCPPFASTWVEKRMHGTATESLQLFYRQLGLEAADMPPDFLGTILECAALLAEDPDQAAASARLWNDHLLPWLPEFSATVREQSRLKIYRAFAARLEDLIDEHRMAIAATGAA